MELYKSISQSVKDVDVKGGTVTGYFSAFDSKDTDGDIIRKGAYAKTIAENGPKSRSPRIKHLLDHDRSKQVAIIETLIEDNYGLYYESKTKRPSLSQDFLLMAEDGFITEHSVYINPIVQNANASEKANDITEARLWEGSSLQCWGANQFTPLISVKSASDVVSMFYRLRKALSVGTYTDDTMMKFQEYYDELGQILKATPPEKSTGPENSQESNSIELLKIFKQALFDGN